MPLLIPIGMISVAILMTLVMWVSGYGFYLTYVPALTGKGIASYSPLWVLALELVVAYALFFKKWWGVMIPFGPALAMSIDIYPAWMILGDPDMSLKFHMVVTALLWGAALSGVMAYRYLD